ncbi:MAG: ribonuclease R [Clostridiales bacterium]
MKNQILEFMEQVDFRPKKAQDLAAEMNIKDEDLETFLAALRELEENGQLIMNKKGRYGLCRHMNLIAGHIEGNPKGFAFFIPDIKDRSDVYIAFDNLNGAMHKDRVIIRVIKSHQYVNGREEGEVVRILHHANERVVGIYEESNGGFGFVRPDEKRIGLDIFIPKEDDLKAKEGDVVVANIVKWPKGKRNPQGKITEIIGSKNEKGTDMLTVIRKYQLPEAFPADVLAYAESVSKINKEDYNNRRDLRDLQIVTMDGADAKDLDDAISLSKTANGNFLLGVHIADVGNYVKARSLLDREAYSRGTSVYFPDRVIPMLPQSLSNGICSLSQGEDRLTLSCEMEIDKKGRVVDYEIFESVINSKARMTYDAVNSILEGDVDLTAEYGDFKDMFFSLDRLRQILYDKRSRRGALMFDFPEAKVILDEDGNPTAIEKRVQGKGESIIEECMIVANETVATEYFNRDIPFIYRVHDVPPDDKVLALKDVLASCGLSLGTSVYEIKPYTFQKILTDIEGTPEAYLLQTVILRTMSHAVYETENRGHFGLASDCYCHFTSPIRRYPDLCIHRVIKDMIHAPYVDEVGATKLWKRLNEAANQSSVQERNAEEAEREATDIKKVQYMERHLGEDFDGIISGTTAFGFFVELDNTVNGLVHVSSLDDDYYEYHENTKTLMGKRNQVCYRLGDQVRVKVSRVNLEEHLIDFELVSTQTQDAESVENTPKNQTKPTKKGSAHGKTRRK